MSRRRRPLVVLATSALLVLIAVVAWVGVRGWQAKQHLTQAAQGVTTLQSQVVSGDVDAARSTLHRLQDDTAEARSLTSDPVWRAAEFMPFVGDDLAAAATLSAEVDQLATTVLDPLVSSAAVLDPAALQPHDGTIDLAPLQAAAPLLSAASTSLESSREAVRAIPVSGLTSQVGDARASLLDALDDAASLITPAAVASQIGPDLLGADEPQDILVLFQNNAEIRASGGMPGATALLTTDHGQLSLTSQGGALPTFDEPVLELPPGVVTMFADEPGVYLQDVNMTADWPLSARLAREMYRLQTGTEVDAVVATDPVALSYLLEATGPVTLPPPSEPGTTLTGDNAVDYLLSDVYQQHDPETQDEVFAAAAAASFAGLLEGVSDPRTMLEALGRGASEGRWLLWSADSDHQAAIAETALAGPLRPAGTGGDPDDAGDSSPVIGVFLNSAVPGKLDYYLRQRLTLSPATCRLGTLRRHELTIELTSTAPLDAATSLPDWVAGGGRIVPVGHNRVQVVAYGPEGGSFGQMLADGDPIAFGSAVDAGRPTALTTTVLPPGQTSVLSLEVLVPEVMDGYPVLRSTPTVAPASVEVEPASADKLLPLCTSD